MEAGEGDENGRDYVRRARRDGEKRWKREKEMRMKGTM
jgi:hypothetical protein